MSFYEAKTLKKGDYQDKNKEKVASHHQTNHFLMYVRFTSADVRASRLSC